MSDISLDKVLDLEDQFYSQGFAEGHEHSVNEQFLEGKVYGLQTGFQRFLIVGYMQGLLEEWKTLSNDAIKHHLDQLEKSLSEISPSNDGKAVAQYERAISRARNKARIIASLTRTGVKLDKLDDLIREVGGSLQISENQDEMW